MNETSDDETVSIEDRDRVMRVAAMLMRTYIYTDRVY